MIQGAWTVGNALEPVIIDSLVLIRRSLSSSVPPCQNIVLSVNRSLDVNARHGVAHAKLKSSDFACCSYTTSMSHNTSLASFAPCDRL